MYLFYHLIYFLDYNQNEKKLSYTTIRGHVLRSAFKKKHCPSSCVYFGTVLINISKLPGIYFPCFWEINLSCT